MRCTHPATSATLIRLSPAAGTRAGSREKTLRKVTAGCSSSS